MQILPTFDLGGALGKGIGKGFADVADQASQQQLIQSGLLALDKLNLDEASPLDIVKGVTGALAGLRGGPQIAEAVLPILLQRTKTKGITSEAFRPTTTTHEPTQRQQPSRVGGVPSVERDSYADITEQRGGDTEDLNLDIPQVRDQGLKDRLVNLHRNSADRLSQLESRSGVDLATSPEFQQSKPAYNVPSLEEMGNIAAQMTESGASPQEIYQALDQRTQQGLKQYQSQLADWERSVKEQSIARDIEDEQLKFLSGGPERQGGAVSSWLTDNKIPNSQFWHDIAYKKFDEVRAKNPGLRDQQIWNRIKPSLDNLKDLEIRGKEGLARPQLFDSEGKKIDSVQRSKAFADDYKKNAGNTPEVRERLISLLMDEGWERPLAHEIVTPLTNKVEKIFNKIPSISDIKIPQREGADAFSAKALEIEERLRKKEMEKSQPLIDKMIENFTFEDSPYVLRNKFIYEKGYDPLQANEIITKLRRDKGITETQAKEIPLLEGGVPQILPQPTLYDIFQRGIK